MSTFPSLPPIEGDLLLEVFYHRSTKNTPEGDENAERLAELGSSVLNMVIIYSLFSKRPLLAAHELKAKHQLILDHKIPEWLSVYSLKTRVRGISDRSILDQPEECRFLFNSYVGAVYVQKGLAPVTHWISRLVDPESEPLRDTLSPPPYSSNSTAASIPQPPIPELPPTSVQPSLAMFNQICFQRGLTVRWEAQSDGPPHQPRWLVKCFVNDIQRGEGAGRNQKVAKEEAAKKAFVTLG